MANNSVVTQEVLQNTLENYHENFVYPYLNGATHAGFTPVGTVISYFGETAPEYFLVCDGTEYAKSDYPQLADLLLNLTDPTPYEGSDSDHFKVPDLRGEFLRGTGTNGHTDQGSGADVGEHQDGTTNLTFNISDSGSTINVRKDNNSGIRVPSNYDFETYVTSQIAKITADYPNTSSLSQGTLNTSRPTNTSVLYCIAYKNIYIDLALDSFPLGISNPTDGQALVWNGTEGRWKNAGILHEYSTDEKVVGTWIDGKPLYEKTFVSTIPPYTQSQTRKFIPIGSSVDYGWITGDSFWCSANHQACYKFPYLYATTTDSLTVMIFSNSQSVNSNTIVIQNDRQYLTQNDLECYITICYTKTTDTAQS